MFNIFLVSGNFEGREAYTQHVVFAFQRVRLFTNDKRDSRKRCNLLAIDNILKTIKSWIQETSNRNIENTRSNLAARHGSRSDLLVKRRDFLGWAGNKGGSGVNNALATALAVATVLCLRRNHKFHCRYKILWMNCRLYLSVHFHSVNLDLPITFARHRHVREVAAVVLRVTSAQNKLTARLWWGISTETCEPW